MATTAINPRAIASILGGDVTGRDSVLVPGPVHSKPDRSLSIKVDPTAPLGFRVYSCCRPQNDWQTCRDYVCAALGLRRDSVPPRGFGLLFLYFPFAFSPINRHIVIPFIPRNADKVGIV